MENLLYFFHLISRIKPRPLHLWCFGQGLFAGGALSFRIPLAIHPRPEWRGILAGFYKNLDGWKSEIRKYTRPSPSEALENGPHGML
jgi:hypothetical protein